jgi:hypothetical protein
LLSNAACTCAQACGTILFEVNFVFAHVNLFAVAFFTNGKAFPTFAVVCAAVVSSCDDADDASDERAITISKAIKASNRACHCRQVARMSAAD